MARHLPYPRVVLYSLATLMLFLVVTVQPTLAQEQLHIEERARALDQQLICPVCPGETLHQSQATLAKQMRQIIRDRLETGQSEQQILAYFVSVYGDSVLAAPPRRGFWLIAWLVPPLGIAAGAVVIFLTVRALRRAPAQATDREPPAPAAETAEGVELGRYLKLVDQEMGGVREEGTTNKDRQRDQGDASG